MDAIATPRQDSYRCIRTAECTAVKVPRDDDRPQGAQAELALVRVQDPAVVSAR
jgi:hypothetical protein